MYCYGTPLKVGTQNSFITCMYNVQEYPYKHESVLLVIHVLVYAAHSGLSITSCPQAHWIQRRVLDIAELAPIIMHIVPSLVGRVHCGWGCGVERRTQHPLHDV